MVRKGLEAPRMLVRANLDHRGLITERGVIIKDMVITLIE